MLGDFFEVAGQHVDRLVDLGARVVVEGLQGRGRDLLQFLQQLDRQCGKIVDEVERVLDLVRDAGGQLAERRHFLRLHQAGLRCFQVGERLFGRVAGGADFRLGALAFGDVAEDQHKAAARHRVAPHLDDPAVGPGALEARFLAGVFDIAADFGFEFGLTGIRPAPPG